MNETELLAEQLASHPWLRFRPPANTGGILAITEKGENADDERLIGRITKAFRLASQTPVGASDSMWLGPIADIKKSELQTMLEGSQADIARLLRWPHQNNLFYGFDTVCAEGLVASGVAESNWQAWFREWIYDGLLRLAEAVGTVRLEYPEAMPRPAIREVEELLNGLDGAFGFRIRFPNPFPHEAGLLTERGIASWRAVQALYQAWRIFRLVEKIPSAKVLEIGGGLGRTAFFARQFGIENYTIVDLPLTGVAQAYHLGRTLGEDKVRLFGEDIAAALAILPPCSFLGGDGFFDLIVNVDSMTEMAESTAHKYWSEIAKRTPIFLSVNHEFNPFTVSDLIRSTDTLGVTRHPYWLRRGYVEELVHLKQGNG